MNKEKLHIHLIGIGGVGMSAIAFILLDLGYKISGSDIIPSKITAKLVDKGATFYKGHNKENIQGANLVVVSSAIAETNPEIKEAEDKNVTIIKRAEMLSDIMNKKSGIAIAGTHGKTTTTSMVGLLLEKAGFDPTVIVGGEGNNIKGNAKFGLGEYIVAEADESDGTFLKLNPHIAVITNIEDDHMEYYEKMENILKYFRKFSNKINDNGRVILCKDCKNVQKLLKNCRKNFITYGISEQADFMAKEIIFNKLSSKSKIYYKNKKMGELHLNIPGNHNILNALASVVVAKEIGIDFKEIAEILRDFKGVKRRMEIVSDINSEMLIIDDYAHHPTEIVATLSALRNSWKDRRLIAVFQPHRFTRTKLLAEKFGKAFFDANYVIVNDIYAANEPPIAGISGETIFNEIKKNNHKHVKYIPSKNNILRYLNKNVQPGDIVITMGAGDVWTISRELAKQ